MLHSLIAKATALLATVVIVWAVTRGGWPERIAGIAIATDWIGSTLFQDRRPDHHGQPAMFALDILQAAVLLGLTVRCRRTWVLWATALACLLVLTHIVFLLNASFGQWSYLTVNYVWSIGLLASLAGGMAFEEVKRTRRVYGEPRPDPA